MKALFCSSSVGITSWYSIFLGAFRMRASCFIRILFLCSLLLVASLASAQTPGQKPAASAPANPAAPASSAPMPSAVSRHYPILIFAHGNEPNCSLRLGMKGSERLDRHGYLPVVLDPTTKFQPPTAIAYLDSSGKVIFSRSAIRRTVAPEGSELAVSHDGKKLLYTRADSPNGPERTIVLYDWDTGRLRDLATTSARSAFWSPDDSRVAFLKYDGKVWQACTLPVNAPETAAQLSPQDVDALHGWISPTTLLASDLRLAYWLSDDKPAQTIALKDIHRHAFPPMNTDTIR